MIYRHETYEDGVLIHVVVVDTDADTVTTDGETRPMTPEEVAYYDGLDNKSAIETNLEADLLLMQAILDDTNANINSNPAARIKEMCRMLKRLGRTAIDDYSEAD